MIKDAVARRYAKGLFDVACEMNIVDQVAGDLDRLADLLEKEPDIREVLEYARVPSKVKKEIIANLLQDSTSSVVLGFFELLVDKHREKNFGAICEAYRDLVRKYNNIVVAKVESAYPLETRFAEQLQSALEKNTGKTVELNVSVQPKLLGGLVVQIGDRIYDGSVTKHLEMMRARIMEGTLGKLEGEI